MIKKGIVIHCSSSPFGNPILINDWHKKRGFSAKYKNRPDEYNIGYHYVITNGRLDGFCDYEPMWDGVIMSGRPAVMRAAHAVGCNTTHLGICLIGRDKFTQPQLRALWVLCKQLCNEYSISSERIIGHYETKHQQNKAESKRKTCPNMPMKHVRHYLQQPSLLAHETIILMNLIGEHNRKQGE